MPEYLDVQQKATIVFLLVWGIGAVLFVSGLPLHFWSQVGLTILLCIVGIAVMAI